MPLLSEGIKPSSYSFRVPVDSVPEDVADSDGRIRAREGLSRPGRVGYSRMSMPLLGTLHPGIYRLFFSGLRVEAPKGEISGYLTLSSRYTLPAVSVWSTDTNYTLFAGLTGEDRTLQFYVARPRMGYVHTYYTGTGKLALDGIRATMLPVRKLNEPRLQEIERRTHSAKERPVHAVHRFANLREGYYRVRFNLTGSTFTSFFERQPAPIMTAVYTLPPPARPVAYGAHPPWWLSVPFAGDEARQLRFTLDEAQDVHVLLQYKGKSDLDLTDIVLYRETHD